MNWNEAELLIRQNINVGIHLSPESNFRYILAGPEYSCFRYNYDGVNGYKVKIAVNTDIEIPLTMLEAIYNATIINNSIYNKHVIEEIYPQQVRTHGCHVHVVAKIFQLSGIMNQNNPRQYSIL